MKIVSSSPILISETKKGLKKYWQGHIVSDNTDYYLSSESWQELAGGGESKHNESVPYLVTPKNIGKANETTPLQQAEFELASMVKKQIDSKGYFEIGKQKKTERKLPLPMLAHKYRDHAKKIKYPCFIQRKLDGNRMLFDGVHGQSRGGKPNIPEVIEHLQFDCGDYILDGELILPENPPLQTTMTAIKKYTELSKTLLYHVYDTVDETMPFKERLQILKQISKKFPPNVKFVETYWVQDESEMIQYHQQFVLEGYEGTILRNSDGKYDVNHRSYDLQKHKDFLDEEFLITKVVSGEGLYTDCAILVCETEDGKEFRSNPEGTIEYKKELYKNKASLMGKYATIRYFNKSIDGIPIFNITVGIRDVGEF